MGAEPPFAKVSRIFVFSLLLACGSTQAASAADVGAEGLTRIFIDACIPNMGELEKVRLWAQQQHLTEIQNQPALNVFVGSGTEGAAWAVPTGAGNFALAIRGKTQGCVVFGQKADPAEAQAYFRKLVEGAKKPGLNIKVEKDETSATPAGVAHMLAYDIWAESAPKGFVFLMMTVEHPNAAFQAWFEVARSSAPSAASAP